MITVLGFDPGAEKMGWSVIRGGSDDSKNKDPVLLDSGVFRCPRTRNGSKPEPYHEYRLRLIDYWITKAPSLLERHRPDVVVVEIVPVVGGGNFVAATQSQLATTAITTCVVVARQNACPVEQIGATSVKARIGGSKKSTKVAVRNGVWHFFPEMECPRSEWVADETDACAVALTWLGYRIGTE